MRVQKQPSPWTCLVTSFAIVIDVDARDLMDEIGHDGSEIVFPALPEPYNRRSHHVQELIDCCERRGIWVTPFDAMPTSSSIVDVPEPYLLKMKLEPGARFTQILTTHIGVIVGQDPERRPHAFVWDGKGIIDPALASRGCLSRYGIRQLWAIRAEQQRKNSA
jgi:hypothetical protein